MTFIWFFLIGPAIAVLPGWAAGYLLDCGARRIRSHAVCWKCGYSRQGLRAKVPCPECGSPESRPRAFNMWAQVAWAAPFTLWFVSVVSLIAYLRWSQGSAVDLMWDILYGSLFVMGPSIVTILIWSGLFATIIEWRPLAFATIAACFGAFLAFLGAIWSDAHAQSDEEMNFLLSPVAGPVVAMVCALCVAAWFFFTGRKQQRAMESEAGEQHRRG